MSAIFQELIRAGLYKRSQGRITRQATFASLAIVIALGMLRLMQTLEASYPQYPQLRFILPGVLFAIGCWVSYRLVNYPSFADFLIAVEAEMNKVSWPTRNELIRSSLVVLIVIFVLAAVLFLFDAFWSFVFRNIIPIL